MFRILRVVILAAVVTLSIHACIFSPKTEAPEPPQTEYVAQTSPENVVVNLQVSYRRREIAEYAKLLATDFRFVFQQSDPSAPPEGFWTRDEDSTGTEALFRTPEVTAIRIDLLHGPPEKPSRTDLPEGTQLIRINQTFLEVDEQVGITWQVTDLQDMYFRPGLPEVGENPEFWYLVEWVDLPGSQAPAVRPTSVAPDVAIQTRASSWGSLRERFRPPGDS